MKKHKKLKIFSIVVLTIVIFMVTINIIPPSKVVKNNPFIKNENDMPMVAAHRGGSTNNPENTMKAFKKAVEEYDVKIIESDLWLTKDNHLVYNHDESFDSTCDVVEYENNQGLAKKDKYLIEDYTLEDLQNFNFGYYFEDENGNRPYKDVVDFADTERKNKLKQEDLAIVEVEELFKEYYDKNKDLLFIVEIKNPGERGYIAADILNELLTVKYPDYQDNVVIGTFHDEIEKYLNEKCPLLFTGASTGAAASFIITEMFKLNLFSKDDFVCLQIPMSYEIKGVEIKLDKRKYIKRAHKKNIAVQYWTINEEDEMRRLISLGCDAIMTDNPKLLKEVIASY